MKGRAVCCLLALVRLSIRPFTGLFTEDAAVVDLAVLYLRICCSVNFIPYSIMYVLDSFGYEMKYFRAPMGEYSELTLALAKSLGYTSMFWSFAYVDWETDNQPEPETAFERITTRAHGGAVYLLHAVSRTNAEILGEVIDALRDRGFEFADYFVFQ